MDGIYQVSWLQALCITFFLTHFTIIAVTLYLHRAMSHRSIDLHPALAHVFRLWLWLTTGMKTKEWVAVHRKHHAEVDQEGDPHSPVIHGVWKVLFLGVWLYRQGAKDKLLLDQFGHGCPEDWVERHIYRHWNIGIALMLVVDLVLWGSKGGVIWLIQMLWIPLTAAGVINGIGHAFGYRNFEPKDVSTNIVPWGILIGGEELHNNHHAYPRSARLSARGFEFDLGYFYIKILKYFGLASVHYVMPKEVVQSAGGMKAILNARMHICREFSLRVMHQTIKESVLSNDFSSVLRMKRLRRLLLVHPGLLQQTERYVLKNALSLDQKLCRVYELRERLYDIFYSNVHADRLEAVNKWCIQAKASNEKSLNSFALWLEEKFLRTEY